MTCDMLSPTKLNGLAGPTYLLLIPQKTRLLNMYCQIEYKLFGSNRGELDGKKDDFQTE